MKWWKHAFAVDPPGPAEPTNEQKSVIDRLCSEVVRRHLTTPALLFLSLCHPMNYFGSQALIFFTPLIELFTDKKGHRSIAEFLEHRGSIEYLCNRIEELEAIATNKKTEEDAKNEPSEENYESSFHTEEFP